MIKGSHQTEESKQKTSLAFTGENNPNYGKHLSEVHRKRIPETLKIKHIKPLKPFKVSGRKNRRKRELGFYPLNNRFGGSDAHHIDNTNVIYIPNDIHRTVPRTLSSEKTMERINIIAWGMMESGAL